MARVVHASAEGWFTDCLSEEIQFTDPNDFTKRNGFYFPFAMSASDALELYWRVKRWEVIIDLKFTGEIFPDIVINNAKIGLPFQGALPVPPNNEYGLFIGQGVINDGFYGFVPPSEDHLVCLPNLYPDENGEPNWGPWRLEPDEDGSLTWIGSPGNYQSIGVNLGAGVVVSFTMKNLGVILGNAVYPRIDFFQIFWSGGIVDFVATNPKDPKIQGNYPLFFPSIGNFKFVLSGGRELIFPISCRSFVEITSVFCNFTLIAREFWPYDGLYDPATGLRLP